jgi:hypothetical protein
VRDADCMTPPLCSINPDDAEPTLRESKFGKKLKQFVRKNSVIGLTNISALCNKRLIRPRYWTDEHIPKSPVAVARVSWRTVGWRRWC